MPGSETPGYNLEGWELSSKDHPAPSVAIESGFEPSFGRRTDAGASGQHPQIPASSEHLSPNIAIESAFEGRFPDQFQQNRSPQKSNKMWMVGQPGSETPGILEGWELSSKDHPAPSVAIESDLEEEKYGVQQNISPQNSKPNSGFGIAWI